MNLIYDFSNTSPIDYTMQADYIAPTDYTMRNRNLYKRTEPSRIYLARPNKRLLGALNGVDESSCSFSVDFINADEISFDVYRYLGVSDSDINNYWYGYYEESSWYHYIDILMEIYVDGFGWFFIDESPTIHNDGIKEYKNVIAKSYEYTLHQYDLESFDINTATSTSREMLAEDNVYTYYSSSEVYYNIFRDRVLFYRDTTEHKALLEEMDDNTTYEQLQSLLVNYPHFVQTAWRIEFDLENIADAFAEAKENTDNENEKLHWQDMISNASSMTSEMVKNDLIVYPELIQYLTLIINKKKMKFDGDNQIYSETEEELTAYELVEQEYKRIKGLSLLDLCLSDVPDTWTIGYVDNTIPEDTNGEYIYKDASGFPILLKDETGSFEIDAQDVYTFMVNELAGYFNCIFQFDTVNNIINVYRIESIGVNTRIFLGFRNVENELTITPAQELFTQFTVENSDGLGITNVNFGQREIEDISYFLKPEYLPQELIDKYKRYIADRENKRGQYIKLSRQHNKQLEECNELLYRVPSDMLNIAQLDNYKSQDQLEESIANYYALLVGMLNAFIFQETDGDRIPKEYSEDDYASFDEYITAWDEYIDYLEGMVDANNPAGEGAITFEDSLYYDSYCACREFTIPNLAIAYKNLDLPSYEEKTKYKDSFEYIFDEEHPDYSDTHVHYGDWYGVEELEAYQKTHLDKMQALEDFATSLEDIEDAAENDNQSAIDFLEHLPDDYENKHDLYIKYKNGYESASRALETRRQEYEDAMEILNQIYDERKLLADAMLIRNWSEAVSYTIYNQEEEIYLYDDGLDENDEPLDDVFLMLEQDATAFTDAEIDLISRFFRHTDYSNDNINHLENIDTSEIDIDKEMEMLKEAQDELYAESHPQYSYTTTVENLLANNEYQGFHPEFDVGNFIRLGLDDETQVNLRMIRLTFNPMTMDNNLEIQFSNMINYRGKRNDFANLLDSVITSAKNTITARYNKSADKDNTVQVTYDLVQKILQSAPFASYTSTAQTNAISAATGVFSTLSAEYTKTKNLDAEMANIVKLQADSVFANYLKSELVVTKALTAEEATITNLATRALTADSATVAGTVKAENIDTSTLTADSAFMEYLEANLITSSEIDVTDLKAKLAQVDTLTAGSAFVTYLQGISSTTAQSIITDAYIYNAVAGKISVEDLAAGNIVLSNNMTITSANGKMVMNGSALQITGSYTDIQGQTQEYVGIQLGYDTNSNPSLILRNEEGATILTPSGITTDAIADGLIINDMIANSTIQKSKMGFNIVDTDANGNISISNVKDGSGNNFGVEYTNFKTTTNTALSELDEKIDDSATYTLYIYAPNGTNIHGGNITLTAKLFKNSVDVTDDYDGQYFIWTRHSSDSYGDTYWNQNHTSGTKTLTLTGNDIVVSADFECKFEYNGVSVSSNEG